MSYTYSEFFYDRYVAKILPKTKARHPVMHSVCISIIEMLFLFIITILPALIVYNYTYNFQSSQDMFALSVACFAISLVFIHIVIIVFRNALSVRINRLMDYVYLLIGVAGLLGASEITNKIYERSLNEIRDRAISTIRATWFNLDAQKKVFGACSSLRPKDVCEVEATVDGYLYLFVESAPVMLSQRDLVASLKPFERLYATSPYAKGGPARVTLERIVPILKEAEDLGPNPTERYGDLYKRFRSFGYLLISSTIALRIAKVTVELFKLGRKEA